MVLIPGEADWGKERLQRVVGSPDFITPLFAKQGIIPLMNKQLKTILFSDNNREMFRIF